MFNLKNELGEHISKLTENMYVPIPSLGSNFKIISFTEEEIVCIPCFDHDPLDEFYCKFCPINGIIIEIQKII